MRKIKLWLTVWTTGIVGGLIFLTLRLTGRIKVRGYSLKKLIPGPGGLILIFHHPSLWEPVILPFLFFPLYLFNSRFVPISTPDKINYFQKWWFSPFRDVCLPVERGNRREEVKALREMKKILDGGGIIVLAPEGGRTFKGVKFGEEYKYINENGKIVTRRLEERELSEIKVKIRKFKKGIRWLIKNTQADVLFVWPEGGERVIPNSSFFPSTSELLPRFWRKSSITLGERLKATDFSFNEEILEHLENTLLKLGES